MARLQTSLYINNIQNVLKINWIRERLLSTFKISLQFRLSSSTVVCVMSSSLTDTRVMVDNEGLILAFVLALVLGWVVGVLCCVAVVKYLQCMAGKTLVFGPRHRTQHRETRDAVVNPTYGLKDSAASKRMVQFREPGTFQNTRRSVHEYTDVVESSVEITKSDKLSRCPPSSHRDVMSSSMPGPRNDFLQHSTRLPDRMANTYSELDKKTSYSILEPHIQEKGFSFKATSVKQNPNYNMLGY